MLKRLHDGPVTPLRPAHFFDREVDGVVVVVERSLNAQLPSGIMNLRLTGCLPGSGGKSTRKVKQENRAEGGR
jgi:hypothetical protein